MGGSGWMSAFSLLAMIYSVSYAQENAPTTISTAVTLNTTMPGNFTTMDPVSTTTDPEAVCAEKTTCGDCVTVAQCYFCYTNISSKASCRLYPTGKVFPRSEECPLSQARWGVCWLNFEALIISMSVIGGVLLISFITCIYCCCCRSRRSGMVDGTTIKWERETREREQRHADRRAEREARSNEIRQKYGLNRETSNYNRMA